jgi:hypothetical protein
LSSWRLRLPNDSRFAQAAVNFALVELFWWSITIFLMAVGLLGTVLPIVPGTTIIFLAAVIHRVMLGPAKSLGWSSFVLLALLLLTSYVIDFLGGWLGARRFGATR